MTDPLRLRPPLAGLPICLVVLLAVLLTGCAGTLPPVAAKLAHSQALPPRDDGLRADVGRQITRQHGADVSGLRLRDLHANGLRCRLAVIDGAKQTLDVQYCDWFADAAGQLQMTRVIAAANSWQVVAVPDFSLRRHSGAGTLAREPARNAWQRVQTLLFKPMPASDH
ncbi:MAG: hypothetical protein QE285_13315 [Aquabacterium sp.]|nr:hypothetical protein [Aquabacterium sp.]